MSSRQTLVLQNHAFGKKETPGGESDAMSEIKDLKKEIARLTESLSGFASFTQQSMQSGRSMEPKNTFTDARSNVTGALESHESTQAFEKMDLDELHSVQEELKRKI